MDLKEKVSLATGIPLTEQILLFRDHELSNQNTLQSSGVGKSATIHLAMATSTSTSPLPQSLSSVSPVLSIAHLQLNLGLMQLLGSNTATPSHPTPLHLPPHTSHIVHVYDVPSVGMRAFVGFLYSGMLNLPTGTAPGDPLAAGSDLSLTFVLCPPGTAVLALVSCFVLAECFKMATLSADCLIALPPLLSADSALCLVKYAEYVNSVQLRETCLQFLQSHQLL